MKRFSIFFALCFMVGSILTADEVKPPVPLPPGDTSDLLPPPMDLNQMTPIPPPSKNDTAIPPPSPEKNDQTDAALKALDAPKTAAPTATPVKASDKKKVATPTPAAEAPPPPEEKAEASAPAASLGAFADYFPTAKGSKWTYEYLKAEAGSKVKKTRTVECVSQVSAANGGVNVTFQVTDDGQATQEKYSLHDNGVEHTATGDQTYSGDFTYKFPPAGGATWSVTEPNGTVHKSKSSMGKAQVYKKTYPDCVIVVEKILKGGKASTTVFYYYTKGIGLVATEVYSPKMKLIQTSSIALVSGPGDASN